MDIVIWVLLLANENEEQSMIAKVDEWVKQLEIQTNLHLLNLTQLFLVSFNKSDIVTYIS